MSKLFDIFPEELKKQCIECECKKIKDNNSNKLLIDNKDYAFPKQRKLPLISKRNVLSAITHFFNVSGVTDPERAEAYKKITEKAQVYEICTMVFIKQYEAYLKNKSFKESK